MVTRDMIDFEILWSLSMILVLFQPRTASATCSSSSEYAKLLESSASPETRLGRSPRAKSTPSSAQNSPLRMESSDHTCSPQQAAEHKLTSGNVFVDR